MGMNTASVQRLYVAYFNRPADPVSLAVYEAMLPADRVATQAELLVVAEAYFSPSPEYTSNFAGKSNAQIVDQLYQNIFGRTADADGLISWASKLTDGSMTVAELALQLSYSAQGTDATVVAARIEAATTFTNGLDTAEEITGYSGDAAAAQGRAYLAQISGALPTDDAAITASKDAAIANVDASIAAAVEAGGSVPGNTFTLTTGLDSISGTAGNDTVSATLVGAGAAGSTAQPGDTINAAGGTDKLTLSVSGDSAGDYTLQALITDSVEKLHVSNFETDAAGGARNTVTTVDGSLMVGLKEVGLSASSAEGDTAFTNVMNLVDVVMQNGAGDLTVGYVAAVTTGTQAQKVSLSNVSAGTLTINGVENITVAGGLVASKLTALSANSMKTLTVTGSSNFTITNAVDFANDASGVAGALDGTLDASALTGKLSVTSAADEVSITGGSNNDTIAMGATLNAYDVIDGGDGDDTLSMDAATLTTQFSQVSNVETVSINNSTAAIAINASKLSAGVTTLVVDLTDGNDGDAALLASTVTGADGKTIAISKTVEDAADANDSDGTKLTITDTVDSASNAVNIQLNQIGSDNHAATDYFGIDEIDVSTYETINIVANANATGTATANEVEALTATSATTVTVTGTGALETVLTGAKVTTFDASGLAGALTLTAGTEKATYSMGGASSTIAFAGNLNASDTVIGGAGTADTVTASVSGLTATTGALKISAVETVALTTGGANTLAMAGSSGISSLVVTDNKQTITGLDLATTVVLGLAGDESATASEIDVTAADATGTDDTLKVAVNTTNGAATSIIDASNIENLSLTIGRSTTGANNTATLDLTTFEGTSVTVGTGALAAGATVTAGAVDLNTLNAATVSLTSTNNGAVTASMTNATTAVTFSGLGGGIQTITGGLRGDTFTIGSTANVAHVITGGDGTDTTNLTAATGLADVSTINTENVNIALPASVDVTITGDFNAGVNDIDITGGNSLSTFNAGTLHTNILSIDASGMAGNLLVDFAASDFDSTVSVTGGSLATDEITAVLTADGTYAVKTTAVETLDLVTNGDVTVSLAATTGVTAVQVDMNTAAKTTKVSNVTSEAIVLTGAANANNTLEVIPVDATATDNAVSITIKDEDTIAAGAKIKTTDVETVTITSTTADTVDLSLLTMSTAAKTLALNLAGTAGITLSATSAQTTTIDASGGVGVTQTGRSATTAVEYTGSAGNDTFIMMTPGDNIAGGAGTGDTLDVNYAAVLGGISLDLSATGDQISTFDGGATSGTVSGFENADLSGYTGSSGASVVAAATGSVITGTDNSDRITLGVGADDVVFVTAPAASSGDTVISFTGGTDDIDINFTLKAIDNTATVAFASFAAGADLGSAGTQEKTILELTGVTYDGTAAGFVTALGASATEADFASGDSVVFVAYTAGGDAQLWHYTSTGANVTAGELKLVGTLQGVAADSLAAGDFI